jgi:hypothetical protein
LLPKKREFTKQKVRKALGLAALLVLDTEEPQHD